MTKVPWDIGQSMTMRRPTLLRGSRDWHSGQRGPQRLSNSRLICAPISSKITFETTYPLNGAKALMLRTFTPVQGHPDRGCVTRDFQANPSCLGDEEPKKYDVWKAANLALDGPLPVAADGDIAIIEKRTALLNEYKDFVDQEHFATKFDSRSNLHSSILEEFMFYLFKDLVVGIDKHALFGKSHTFKDIFFSGDGFGDMVRKPRILVEKKDHDFAIGLKIIAHLEPRGSDTKIRDEWDIPLVTIECKTYLDKTMLQDASSSAGVVKLRSPNGLCIVVAEWLKLTEAVNLHKFNLDQIFVLRKQRNTDREFRYREGYVKNPIYADAVVELFSLVRTHLTTDWAKGITGGLKKGFLI